MPETRKTPTTEAGLKVLRALQRGTLNPYNVSVSVLSGNVHISTSGNSINISQVQQKTLAWLEKNFPGGEHKMTYQSRTLRTVRGRRVPEPDRWHFSAPLGEEPLTGFRHTIDMDYGKDHVHTEWFGLVGEDGRMRWRCRSCSAPITTTKARELGLIPAKGEVAKPPKRPAPVMADPDTIGGRVLAKRKERGYSRVKLSALSRVTYITLTELERGFYRGKPGEYLLAKLSDALQVSPQWLETGEEPKPIPESDADKTAALQQVVNVVEGLAARARRAEVREEARTVGRMVLATREIQKRSRRWLSTTAKVSERQLQRLEHQRAESVSDDVVNKLALAFDVLPEYLRGVTPVEQAVNDVVAFDPADLVATAEDATLIVPLGDSTDRTRNPRKRPSNYRRTPSTEELERNAKDRDLVEEGVSLVEPEGGPKPLMHGELEAKASTRRRTAKKVSSRAAAESAVKAAKTNVAKATTKKTAAKKES